MAISLLLKLKDMNWQECNVIMLPTEKASNIFVHAGDLHHTQKEEISDIGKNQHLYFLSDEEIKEGDWIYDSKLNIVIQYKSYKDGCKKIIATTDKSLKMMDITNTWDDSNDKSLPRPSNEFLKKYCELGGIDEIMVEYEYFENDTSECIGMDGEPNGTPLNGYRLKVAPDNTVTTKPIKDSWNREEVIELLNDCWSQAIKWSRQRYDGDTLDKEDWIKENL